MNKTIQKLKLQAEEYAGRHGLKNNIHGDALICVLDQKFAELIVAECVSVGMKAWLNDHSIMPTFPGQEIKLHFAGTKK